MDNRKTTNNKTTSNKTINFPAQEERREDFSTVTGERRENLLMETAMVIQEVFDDMFYGDLIDRSKTEEWDSIERFILFRKWSREFEEKYYGTEEYEDNFIGLSADYAADKIKQIFEKEEED